MMSQLNPSLRGAWLKQFRQTVIWAGVFSDVPVDFTTRSELGGSVYVRAKVMWSPVTNDAVIQSLEPLVWSSLWEGSLIVAIGLFSVPTGGVLSAYGALPVPATVPRIDAKDDDISARYSKGGFTLAGGDLTVRFA
jgi:hypothetical protein